VELSSTSIAVVPTADQPPGFPQQSEDRLGAVLPKLRSLLPALAAADRRIADVVLTNPEAVIFLSISELAEQTETAKSTIVRFCQQLGLRGFHDLKLRLAQETAAVATHVGDDIVDTDSPMQILTKVVRADRQTLLDATATVDAEALGAAVRLLGGAHTVLFAGVGTSAPVAQDAAYRFRAIGLRADAPPDVHVQHVAASLLTAYDVCFAVSHTGSTRETLAVVGAAKDAGAATIAVTSFARSPLTELVDHVILAGGREVAFRLEAMASRLAHVAVLDALLVAVALADEERTQRALALYTNALSEHRL
jgi:DNA-binding MurR/RpiR family transcriptional regulator